MDNKQQNNQQAQQQPPSVVLPNHINNDNFILELRYLESPKYDWENIPEEKRGEFANFLKDDRRYISKSVHKMIELGIIKKEFLDMFNEVISEIYFQGPIEPEKIEPDPSRAEDAAYQEEIKKTQEEAEKKAQDENAFNEKIKKKIKISIIKPEVFKKKREFQKEMLRKSLKKKMGKKIKRKKKKKKKKRRLNRQMKEEKILKLKINKILKIKKKKRKNKKRKKKKVKQKIRKMLKMQLLKMPNNLHKKDNLLIKKKNK